MNSNFQNSESIFALDRGVAFSLSEVHITFGFESEVSAFINYKHELASCLFQF